MDDVFGFDFGRFRFWYRRGFTLEGELSLREGAVVGLASARLLWILTEWWWWHASMMLL